MVQLGNYGNAEQVKMALPNNNNNTYPLGERNSRGRNIDRALRGVGVQNNGGQIIPLKWLDQEQLLANQRIQV